MPIYDNVGGVWRQTSTISDNVGGAWRATRGVYDNVGGVWRTSHEKIVFDDYFSPVIVYPDNLYGTRRVENMGSYLYVELSGYTNGASNPTQGGWYIRNIPAGATVTLDWELYKGAYARNDALVQNDSGVITAESYTFSRKTSSYSNQSGSMSVVLNFFSTVSITSWFKIYAVRINDKQIYPIP